MKKKWEWEWENANGIIVVGVHGDLHPALAHSGHVRGADDVLHEGGLHVRPRSSNRHQALGIHAARPTPHQNLRFLLRPSPRRHWLPPLHGLLRQGSRFSGLLRQGLHASPPLHGHVEDLLRTQGRGSCLGLAPPDCRWPSLGPLLGLLSCLLLEGEVWLVSPFLFPCHFPFIFLN